LKSCARDSSSVAMVRKLPGGEGGRSAREPEVNPRVVKVAQELHPTFRWAGLIGTDDLGRQTKERETREREGETRERERERETRERED